MVRLVRRMNTQRILAIRDDAKAFLPIVADPFVCTNGSRPDHVGEVIEPLGFRQDKNVRVKRGN
jgi:hypothetical protein